MSREKNAVIKVTVITPWKSLNYIKFQIPSFPHSFPHRIFTLLNPCRSSPSHSMRSAGSFVGGGGGNLGWWLIFQQAAGFSPAGQVSPPVSKHCVLMEPKKYGGRRIWHRFPIGCFANKSSGQCSAVTTAPPPTPGGIYWIHTSDSNMGSWYDQEIGFTPIAIYNICPAICRLIFHNNNNKHSNK